MQVSNATGNLRMVIIMMKWLDLVSLVKSSQLCQSMFLSTRHKFFLEGYFD